MSKAAAQRYAKAIYSLAEDSQNTNAIFEDMQLVKSTLASNKNLRLVLESPVISLSQKRNVATEVFKNVNLLSLQLIEVLATNKRIHLLGHVASAIINMHESFNGIQHAHVTTAVEIDAKFEKQIQDKIKTLTGSNAKLSKDINPSLLGGFVLRIKDLQFDASVISQLSRIKRELVN